MVRYEWNQSQMATLEKKFQQMGHIRFNEVAQKSLKQMTSRAGSPAYTPIGETRRLRDSRRMDARMLTMGYNVSYAPHVEYGHRTRGGGYVTGRRFLKKNFETQKPIFLSDINKAIKG